MNGDSSGTELDRSLIPLVPEQLERILRSPHFSGAPTVSRLLQHIVTRTLAGKDDELKEYSLGVEVLERKESYDPRIDPIVRVQMRDVRARLNKYYEGPGNRDKVRISIPKGAYRAEFATRGHREIVAQPVSPSRRRILLWAGAAAAGAVLLAAAILALLRPWRGRDSQPLIRFEVDLGHGIWGNVPAALSPDGSAIAFTTRGLNGLPQLALRFLDQSKVTRFPGTGYALDPFFSPDGQWIGFFADGRLKKIAIRGGNPVTLCDASGKLRGASWGRDGAIIAALGTTTGLSRLSAAGGNPQLVTEPAATKELTHRWPQLLPGGQSVLFTGHTSILDFNNSNVEVVSLKTGQIKTLVQGGYFGRYLPSGHLIFVHHGTLFGMRFDPVRLEVEGAPVPLLDDVAGNPLTGGGELDFSENGTLIYRSGRNYFPEWPIAWMDSAGKTQTLVATPASYYHPRLSPDSTRLAIAGGAPGGQGEISIYDLGRETKWRLPSTGVSQTQLYPVWSPEGTYIVFVSRATSNRLWWTRADGAGEPQLLLESRDVITPQSFSADGRRLVFNQANNETSGDILVLPLDTSDADHPKPGKPEVFLRTQANEMGGSFSPDGHWMAYSSDESGRWEVYVRPYAGGPSSRSGKWLISSNGGEFPFWSRNQPELFYVSLDHHIMVTHYTSDGQSFVPAKPRQWCDKPIMQISPHDVNLDLAPDGKRFVVFLVPERAGGEAASLHLTVLLNFFDEVRRRVPRTR